MSDITRHDTGPRMSQAVVYNSTIYLAGQVSHDDDANVVGVGDPAAQTEQVLKNL